MIVGYSFHVGDLFHVGHLHQLQECRRHCDRLIVGILTDEAVESYKRKPVIPYHWRKAVYEQLRCVDRVIRQDSRNPLENLMLLRPDVLFHGDDWDEIPGSEWMEENGRLVIQTPYFIGVSTTGIIEAIGAEEQVGPEMNEKTQVLLLASGAPERGWTAENPKELAKIGGEPLIKRTLRQLRELGYKKNVLVISHKKVIAQTVPKCFAPKAHGAWSETVLSTRKFWSDRTVIIHGDVIFSERLLKRIMNEQRILQFHGRPGSAFAVVFKRDVHKEVVAALKIAIADYKARKIARDNGMIWQFYRAICGDDLHPDHHDNTKFYTLSSRQRYPQDIDDVADYKRFLKHRAWARDV